MKGSDLALKLQDPLTKSLINKAQTSMTNLVKEGVIGGDKKKEFNPPKEE